MTTTTAAPGGEPRLADTDPGSWELAVSLLGGDAMAGHVVERIRAALATGTRSSELAVLARVNSALLPAQVALTEAGIGHTAPLDTSVLTRTGVRTALAYLRLGLDLERIGREDLLDTLNRPARKVKSAVTPLLRRGTRFSIRQLEQVADALDPTHRDRFLGYLGDLHHLAHVITEGGDTAACLRVVRDRIGLGEAMDALDSSRTRPEGSSHGDDLDALAQLASLHPDPATFRTWLQERLRVPRDPTGVTLSTVHRVKGREWDEVLVVAASNGAFPHRLSDDVEEERRVFHVAITRGRQRVHVVADRARPSPFLAELRAPAARPAATRGPTTTPDPPAPTPARWTAEGHVIAAVGLRIELPGGLTGTIVATDARSASVLLDPAPDDPPLHVPLRTPVTADGRRGELRAPRTGRGRDARDGSGAPEGNATDDVLFDALRQWRARVAAEAGLPAFLVFHDRHLQAIAGRKPRDLRQLAACPGVGPAKLERYGDDVLDLVDAHRD